MQWYVLCGQINLQKSHTSANALMQHLRSSMQTGLRPKAFIVGVQEPPISHGSIKSLSKEHTLIYDHYAGRPRAAIYVSRNLNLWPMSEHTNGDVTTCLWKMGNTQLPELVIQYH